MPGGRPSKFKPEFTKQARKLTALGATVEDLADFFDVSLRTIDYWATRNAEFLQALKPGRDEADDRVERSLYRRATGYTYETEKIFMPAGADEPVRVQTLTHVPPDTTAMIFWLKNRRPNDWREKRDPVTGSGNGDSDERIRERERAADAVLGAVARLAARAAEAGTAGNADD
jgi:hypothetical protein